ncbi:hypothetical protein Tco_0275548 [Tanacetum coccineum]
MQLSPSTPSQPQALEIGETSQKSAIKRHEEQIQGIQCNRLKTASKVSISLARYRIAELAEVINDMETRCNTPKNTTMQRNTTWGATS